VTPPSPTDGPSSAASSSLLSLAATKGELLAHQGRAITMTLVVVPIAAALVAALLGAALPPTPMPATDAPGLASAEARPPL
jgi:hypothetical protein